MTDTTEQKALELLNDVRAESDRPLHLTFSRHECSRTEALCRAIEQLEAEKAARAADREQHEAFRQEVSDAVEEHLRMTAKDCSYLLTRENLARFIIANPDPLVEVLADMGLKPKGGYDWASEFRNTLAQRGGKIVWGEG